MRLISLHIRGFGKFKDFSLTFSEGFQVIHGLNESGKTTIHAFIEGMFYGFIDTASSSRRRSYDERLEEYRPAAGGPYGGSLIFEKDDRRYRIERTFGKKDAEVKLFHEETGEDLSDELDIDPKTKLLDIAAFIDMPHPLYKNTLSVGQLSARTDKTAADLLFNRLKNLDATKTETFSVSRAVEHLEKRHEEIGKSARGKRPYPTLLERKDALEKEWKEAKEHHETLLEESLELEEKKERLTELEKEKRTKEERIAAQENTKRLMRHEEIEDETAKARRILEKTALSRVKIDPAELERAHEDHKEAFASLSSDYDTFKETSIQEESIRENYPDDNDTLSDRAHENLKADYERFEKFLDQKERFDLEKNEHELKTNEAEIMSLSEGLVKKRRNAFIALVAVLPLVGASVVTGLFSWLVPFIILMVLTGVALFGGLGLLWYVKRLAQSRLDSLQDARKKLVQENKKAQETIRMADEEIEKLLKRHKAKDEEDFRRHYYNAETKHKAFLKQKEYDARLKDLQKTRDDIIDRLTPLFRRFDLPKDMRGLQALKELQDILVRIENLLEKKPYKDFLSTIDFTVRVPLADLEKNREAIQRLEEEIASLKEGITAQAAALREKKKKRRELSSIDYELEKTNERIAALEEEKKRIIRAQKLLQEASTAIEETFSPLLRENIESYLPRLTKEHYRNIRIGKTLEFRTEHPTTKRFETKSFLSAGTLDQIHLSIRLGVLKTLKKEDYPLFLDDAFVNFDDERLQNALKLFDELKDKHQIILFTCHTRELSALEEQGITHEVKRI